MRRYFSIGWQCPLLTPATAWANRVFPHPGGPWRRKPLGGTIPSCWYTSGWRMWISSLHTSCNSQTSVSENNNTNGWSEILNSATLKLHDVKVKASLLVIPSGHWDFTAMYSSHAYFKGEENSERFKILTVKVSSLPPTSSNFRVGYCSSGDLDFAERWFKQYREILEMRHSGMWQKSHWTVICYTCVIFFFLQLTD